MLMGIDFPVELENSNSYFLSSLTQRTSDGVGMRVQRGLMEMEEVNS